MKSTWYTSVLFTWLLLFSATGAEWRVIGWNDLGMHCMDGTDFSVFSILPPYNTIHAHVIHNGNLVTSGDNITVTYEAVADANGSINTTSAGKINFWEHAEDMFGARPADDMGLAGFAMPGVSNLPQHMEFDADHNWFTGEGIPISPFDDAGQVNYYPMMRIVVRSGGVEVASTKIVLPVSDEMTCSACHQSGSADAAMPSSGWRWHPNNDKDVKLNILRLHDELEAGNPNYRQALLGQGYNTNGLYQTVVADGTAILCARCHQSNALPVPADPNVSTTMTKAMHSHHGEVIDPETGLKLGNTLNRNSCYRCHPGSDTQCLRGAMGASVAEDGGLAIQCQSCHGTMSMVGAEGRQGWFEEPKCQSCHTGTAADNNGVIRFASVFEAGMVERTAVNDTFAHPDGTLYRFSNGHHELQCSTCHGSPHAIFPSTHENDNVQNVDMQGHKGTVSDCMSCHASQPLTFNGGPHGMHPVGDTAFSRKADGRPEQWFHGQVHEDGSIGIDGCRDCHGTDLRGTELSRTQGDRIIGSRRFWKGYQIGCYTCHNGPNSENTNSDPAPIVSDASAVTVANTPVQVPLVANEGTLRIVSQPQNGTVGLDGTNAMYYPFNNFTGSDSFTFAAWDGMKDSNLGTVQVSVGEGVCVLVCESLVPTNAAAYVDVPFWAAASVSNCSAEVVFQWSFGDETVSSNGIARHAYTQNGFYDWQLVASAGGVIVTNSGVVTVSDVQIDTDGDGIEDEWEWAQFGSLTAAGDLSDSDGDGVSDRDEYLCGTDASNPDSRMEVTGLTLNGLSWSSVSNRTYRISSATSLGSGAFVPLEEDIVSTPPENSISNLTTGSSVRFFRVELQ
ncbi:MAG: hypothetical protein JXR25_02940 [Pontiellaceae bacterium]|nr:hypothetical protein [Pontiellaceae bacterium]MBN2783759.1 hypothetical protein [Pontiellaceae bacterium]